MRRIRRRRKIGNPGAKRGPWQVRAPGSSLRQGEWSLLGTATFAPVLLHSGDGLENEVRLLSRGWGRKTETSSGLSGCRTDGIRQDSGFLRLGKSSCASEPALSSPRPASLHWECLRFPCASPGAGGRTLVREDKGTRMMRQETFSLSHEDLTSAPVSSSAS